MEHTFLMLFDMKVGWEMQDCDNKIFQNIFSTDNICRAAKTPSTVF